MTLQLEFELNMTTDSSTPNELDLAFIIDATGSMGSYIKSAQDVCVVFLLLAVLCD